MDDSSEPGGRGPSTPSTSAAGSTSVAAMIAQSHDLSLQSNGQSPASDAALDPSSSAQSADHPPPYSSAPTAGSNGAAPRPEGPRQVESIQSLKKPQLQVGDTWFVIDRSWYRRWEVACTGVAQEKGEAVLALEDIGPVDSSSIADASGKLTRPVLEGVDVEVVPQEAFKLLSDWYGVQGPVISRKVINTSIRAGEERVEFFPPEFQLYRIIANTRPSASAPPPSIPVNHFALSAGASLADLLERARNLAQTTLPVRLWRLPKAMDEAMEDADIASGSLRASGAIFADKIRETGALLIWAPEQPQTAGAERPEFAGDEAAKETTLEQAMLTAREVGLAVEVQEQGAPSTDTKVWPVDAAALSTASGGMAPNAQAASALLASVNQTNNYEPQPKTESQPLFGGKNNFLSKLGERAGAGKQGEGTSKINILQARPKSRQGKETDGNESDASNGSSKGGGLFGRFTRSKAQSEGRPKGVMGLDNLGNTCFMNSALQCLSNTPELKQYFVSGVWKEELNPDNPLGMHGQVAKAFGKLIDNLWSGGSSSFSPREFKMTLSKFAPAFSGYQQHDSQELLAFLLDGLHEDLNRIKKKPYLEIPDWNGGGDEEMVKHAEKSWEIYKARNDSVIVDLFQGQYRSTLVCPECQKVSITFDPFMYLTLPIPVKKKWTGHAWFFPHDPSQPRVKLTVEVPNDTTVKTFKQTVAKYMHVDPESLICAEEFNHKFWRYWLDGEPITEINGNSDKINFYEVPFKYPQARHFVNAPAKSDEERADIEKRIVVSVMCARPKGPRARFGVRDSSPDLFGKPLIIAIDPTEATTYEGIHKALTREFARYTAKADDLWAEPEKEAEASAGDDVNDLQPSTVNHEPSTTNGVDVAPPEAPRAAVPAPKSLPSSPRDSNVEDKPRTSRLDAFKLFVPKYSFGDIPVDKQFVNAQIIPLEDRARDEAAASAPAKTVSLPGGFVHDSGDDELAKEYGEEAAPPKDGEAASTNAAADSPDGPAPKPDRPIIRRGDFILCQWKGQAISHFFGDSDNSVEQLWSAFDEFIDPEITARATAAKGKKKTITLEDCMSEFTKEEKLGEDDLWYCPSCKKHQQASKRFDLWKMPDVLVIHLKRFTSGRYNRDKLDVAVDFDTDGFNLANRVEGQKALKRLTAKEATTAEDAPASIIVDGTELEEDDSLTYDLFAVDNHFGGLGGGHYTAYAKNPDSGKWYNFDDSRVSPVSSSDNVKGSAAYLLFYRRRTSRPIGGKSNQIIASALQSQANSAAPSTRAASPSPPESSSSSSSSSNKLSGSFVGPVTPPDADIDSPPAQEINLGDDDDDEPRPYNWALPMSSMLGYDADRDRRSNNSSPGADVGSDVAIWSPVENNSPAAVPIEPDGDGDLGEARIVPDLDLDEETVPSYETAMEGQGVQEVGEKTVTRAPPRTDLV